MGRALFSHTYATAAPAIRTEPEPKVDICERYSAWNRFDPDSEDFFQNAEYEAFVDTAQFGHQQVEMPALVEGEGHLDSPGSSDSGVSDQGSPMAVGSDDPAILIADAYTIRATRWEDYDNDISSPSNGQWRTSNLFVSQSPPPDQLSIPPFIPPSSFREASPAIESVPLPPNDPPRSPTLRRATNITPIVISRTQIEAIERSPPPDSPSVPSTPPSRAPDLPGSETLLTPSPPPSVTPRFYSWQHHPIPAMPTSPSLIRGNRDGPLTNPRARMSFARIEASPARIRIPSSVM